MLQRKFIFSYNEIRYLKIFRGQLYFILLVFPYASDLPLYPSKWTINATQFISDCEHYITNNINVLK